MRCYVAWVQRTTSIWNLHVHVGLHANIHFRVSLRHTCIHMEVNPQSYIVQADLETFTEFPLDNAAVWVKNNDVEFVELLCLYLHVSASFCFILLLCCYYMVSFWYGSREPRQLCCSSLSQETVCKMKLEF